MTTARLDAPAGYICRITRTQNVTMPHEWKSLPDLRKVLYMAWCDKMIVRRTMEQMQSDSEEDENDDDDLARIMEPPEEYAFELPDTFTSPDQPQRFRSVFQ